MGQANQKFDPTDPGPGQTAMHPRNLLPLLFWWEVGCHAHNRASGPTIPNERPAGSAATPEMAIGINCQPSPVRSQAVVATVTWRSPLPGHALAFSRRHFHQWCPLPESAAGPYPARFASEPGDDGFRFMIYETGPKGRWHIFDEPHDCDAGARVTVEITTTKARDGRLAFGARYSGRACRPLTSQASRAPVKMKRGPPEPTCCSDGPKEAREE